jgi:nicotinamide-nucleotide adenylyltransferase
MKKYKVALFIGRFQPFHNGHLYSLEKCLELAEKVIVGIGSSEESETESNPCDFETRKKMVEALRGKSSKVLAIPDNPSDEVWVENVTSNIKDLGFSKDEVVVVSNNEWVTGTLGKAGFPIYQTGLYNRDELEGVKIRKMMRVGDERWKLRVPKEILGQIDMRAI